MKWRRTLATQDRHAGIGGLFLTLVGSMVVGAGAWAAIVFVASL